MELDVLLVRPLELSLGGVEQSLLLERLDTNRGDAALLAESQAPIQRSLGALSVALQSLRARGGLQRFGETLAFARLEVGVVEYGTQRVLGLHVSAEHHLRVRDGVEARSVERDVVSRRKGLHAPGDLHRLMWVARVVLQPGEVVENLQTQLHIIEILGELQRCAIALARSVVRAGAHQHDAESDQMIRAQTVGHRVIDQLNRANRVLP